ncbi:hypothetical protein K0B96_03520 [Horticoccus luteus]|uniref:Tetratricopeptide repeat protein n=1 Tax=Horticoccus luteus TaxID=2862869 RepID=A0A8F9TXA9_9BACT|nr:hypothetical protein [Horticoccus luteus]QYM79701.1 hypothetical protein K0B96_03520 [Horticoccus luteus]
MKIRFRLVWNKHSHHDRRARGFKGLARVIEDESTAGHYKTLWLDARALLKIAGAAALALWFGGAGLLYAQLRSQPFNRVRYTDLVLPWHWTQIRDLRGQGYIAAGFDALAHQKLDQAMFDFRHGLSRHPDAPDARLALAQVYARYGYYRGVRDIMLPQLDRSRPPTDFIHFLVQTSARFDDHATVLSVCDRLLPGTARDPAEHTWILEQKARALIALERYADAQAVLDEAGVNSSLNWRSLHVQAQLGLGHGAALEKEVRAWSSTALPTDFQLQILSVVLSRRGDVAGLTKTIESLQQRHPTEPAVWTEAIGLYSRAGARDAAWLTLQDALRRFDGNPTSADRLAQAALDSGHPDLVALCVEDSRGLGRSVINPLTDLTVTYLKVGDLGAANDTFKQLLTEDQKILDNQANLPAGDAGLTARTLGGPGFGGARGVAAAPPVPLTPVIRDWLQTLLGALAMPADDRAEAHCSVLQQGNLGLTAFTSSAESLAQAGHWPAVAAVARTGLVRFPGSTRLTRWSDTAADKIAALPAPTPSALPAPADGSAPPAADPTIGAGAVAAAQLLLAAPAAPASVYAALTPTEFLAKLDAAAQRQAWPQVQAMIRDVRAENPSWLAQTQSDIAWREVRCALELQDPLSAAIFVAQQLHLRPLEAPRALTIARETLAHGDRDTARRLAEAIVNSVPQFKPGQSFLQELRQPPAPAAPSEKRG